jgi:protein subunit release factor B
MGRDDRHRALLLLEKQRPRDRPPRRLLPARLRARLVNRTEVDPLRRAQALRALSLSDDQLRAECVEEFFIASGPGGQHRNKTESGVRLTHPPTQLSVTATERRSQWMNRQAVMERLREGLKALTFVPKVRRKTRATRGSVERRLEGKRRASARKSTRKIRSDD